jgi:hypothetical protein
MSYSSKPSFIRKDSVLCDVLKSVSSGDTVVEDFDRIERKDALYPATRHGFVKIFKNGKTQITGSGKKLVKAAK